ncbi:MAG TPA: purine nucleoside permease [Sphingobium sp.]|jgi:purine nucleoside permease|uniref:purine nucleoside permease n=1 Tax=Sphingobium sp. TaxID=1912891 RepID=UPI000EDC81B6|nr:purine nucleoside permease [Sphingobium sp.]HAF42189.1 purine nucleoside permease [Sphingobium sp.]
MHSFFRCVLPIASLSASLAWAGPAPAAAATSQVEASLACAPAMPCAARIPVRMVIVTMFEIGADQGDAPGEFQLWKERRRLDTRIPFPQGYHDLFYNPDSQILAMVTGVGTARSSAATMALGLDPRFDLGKAYWLVAGIAGIDPEDASIGSAAWARYSVDGDLAHEIDAREIPKDWTSGFFPLDKKGPADTSPPITDGRVFAINPGLVDWAFALTKDVAIPDDPGIQQERARYMGYPNAQKPPFVLIGDQLSAMTFWHGKLLNRWANDFTRYSTGGKGEFVTSAMEETGTLQAISYLDRAGRADKDRVLVLRSGSNYSMPPDDVPAADNLMRENEGYSGMRASLESLYLVGSKVVDELLGHWDRYEKAPPQ